MVCLQRFRGSIKKSSKNWFRGMIVRFFGCFIVFFLTLQVKGQGFIVEKYSDKQGLNHSVVYRVFQDSQGFIWAATDNGLNRFDGNEFTSLNSQSSLVSDYVFGMNESENKLLFTSYNNGIIEYSVSDRIFRKNPVFKDVKKPIDIYSHKDVLLVVDNVARLWIFKNNKLLGNILDVTSVNIENGEFYLSTGTAGIQRLRFKDNGYYLEKIYAEKGMCVVQTLALSNNRKLIIETEGVFVYNSVTKKQSQLPGSGNLDLRFVGYQPAFKDSYGDVWLGTADGRIYQLRKNSNKLNLIFTNTVVNQFFEDSNRNLWIATYGFGLWKIPVFRTTEYVFNGHLATDFGVVTKGNQNHFVSYRQLYLPIGNQQIQDDIKLFRKNFQTNNSEGIVYSDDKHFFYSQKYRLFCNDWNNGTKEVLFGDEIKSVLVSHILRIGNNEFVIGTRNGAFVYDASKNKVRSIKRLQTKIIYSINNIGKRFVFCTNDGVYVGELHTLSRINFPEQQKTESIRSAILLSENMLVVGSNKRIFYFNLSTQKVRELYKEVFCSKIIRAYGLTWVLCDKGLIRIDNKWKVHLISPEYGVPGWAKSMQVKNGKFFILYQDKILEVAANRLLVLPQSRKFKLFVDYVNFDGKNHFTVPKAILLDEPLKKMVFKFTIPRYMDIKTASYYVKINNDVELEGSRTGKFNILSLPNGDNKLMFYALNEDKRIIAKKVYYIHNPYPYWRHPMMQITYLLIIVMISWFIFSRRIKKLNERKALEMETNRLVYELKQKSLLNMLNPHFLNNAINSIQAFVVMNDQRKTLKYLSQFARLMRLNLELMNSSMVPLSKEVDSIRFYVDFEQVRTSGTFDFEVETKVSSELADFLVPSFIIQPFVENAIWHGILTTDDKKGKIHLIIEEREDDILIVVDDDGIGIEKSMNMKSDNSLKISLGTKIIKERFEILKKGDKRFQIEIIDKSDFSQRGTQVVITVPKTFQSTTD